MGADSRTDACDGIARVREAADVAVHRDEDGVGLVHYDDDGAEGTDGEEDAGLLPLGVADRLAMMELYRQPVGTVTAALQNHFVHFGLPLRPRQKQLADFLIQLQMEMAYGYKHIVAAGQSARRPWEDENFRLAMERTVRYLGEVLLRAYQVYMPVPTGVWREIHDLYRYSEQHACAQLPLADEGGSIAESYLQVLMLGLCGPYQLPQNECHQVNAFLARWTRRVRISPQIENVDPVGQCVILNGPWERL